MKVFPIVTGPRPDFAVGHLTQFGRDPLAFLERCAAEHGDFVALRFVNKPVLLLNHPDLIETVLGGNLHDFRKTIGYRTPFMRRLFGEGLLTSEGELWMRQRRLAQPAFHRDRIAGYGTAITGFAEALLREWRLSEQRNVHHDMMRLTTNVVTKTLFNSPPPPEIDEMGAASEAVMERFTKQWSLWRFFLALFPSPSSRRFDQVMTRLDRFIYGLIRERRATERDEGDLLSMLLRARDEEGKGMNDHQLRDELVTLMVAGLDTTALSLSWAFLLLAQNPAAETALHAELDNVLGGRPAGFADLPRLPYTEAVIRETMRLYPPAWLVGREAVRDCQVGGQTVRAGTSLLMSQWLQHREARHFAEPRQFRPERWLGGGLAGLSKYAYFPFGGGPRVCIGSGFALLEAGLVLATVAGRFRLTAPAGYEVKPWPAITLQPRGGVWLRVEPR